MQHKEEHRIFQCSLSIAAWLKQFWQSIYPQAGQKMMVKENSMNKSNNDARRDNSAKISR